MKYWTAHLRADREPILLREGFSWGGLFLGPFWLAGHRAWVPAALTAAAWVLIAVLTTAPVSTVLALGLAFFTGFTGRDLVRWSLAHRGYLLAQVLAARSMDEAWGRLLAGRPDLAGRFMPAGSAR